MNGLPRVLLVDDEDVLRRSLLRATKDRMDMIAVSSGPEALELLSRDRDFVVLFLDIMMPEMSGIELLREIARRWPGLEERIVFVTGGSFGAEDPTAGLPNLCLRKPVSLGRLEEEVAKRLGSAS